MGNWFLKNVDGEIDDIEALTGRREERVGRRHDRVRFLKSRNYCGDRPGSTA